MLLFLCFDMRSKIPLRCLSVCTLWHVYRYNCKTIDITSPVASPKPADWKFVSAAGSPWIELHCTLNVEFFISFSESDLESAGTLRKQLDVISSFIY